MKEIPLTKGMVALVDDEDYELVSQYRWFARQHRNTYYATRNYRDEHGRKRPVDMHLLLMGRDEAGREVDHADGNGLNDQRANLRWATPSEQRRNSAMHRDNRTGFKGVSFDKERGMFVAQLTSNYQKVFHARFRTAEEAARAYDEKAREVFGSFARLNFPDEHANVAPPAGFSVHRVEGI